MKIGVSSYSFQRYRQATGATLLDICNIAKEIGYDGIEFIDLQDDSLSQEALADALRERCNALDLPIVAYTVRADFLEGEGEVERLQGQVDIARRLGAKVLRHDISWRRDIPWRDMIAMAADSVRAVSEYAQNFGIRTCTENHGYVLQDAQRMEELMRAVNHPNYGWLVDMGNFLCADEPPAHAMPIAAPYAVHAHAKDFLWKSAAPDESWIPTRNGNALRGTILGHGVVPVADCVRELRKAGYDGWLSLEFEGLEDTRMALQYGLALLRKAIAENETEA